MSDQEFDAMAELGKLLTEGDFNVRLFGVPVAGPQARSLHAAIDARIAAAVAAEREACAAILNDEADEWLAEHLNRPSVDGFTIRLANHCERIRNAIRARGGTP